MAVQYLTKTQLAVSQVILRAITQKQHHLQLMRTVVLYIMVLFHPTTRHTTQTQELLLQATRLRVTI